MKWTNKKPTKEGFYLYVDQLNTDGNPIVLYASDITETGCQPEDPADKKWHKELAKKSGRCFQAHSENDGNEILFQWFVGEVNQDKNAYWSAEPIALPKTKPRKEGNHIEKDSLVNYKGYLYVVSSCNKHKASLRRIMGGGRKLAFRDVPLEKLTLHTTP